LQTFIPVGHVVVPDRKGSNMQSEYNKFQRAGAAGWAFLVWLFGGGLGLAILVFIVLKALGG